MRTTGFRELSGRRLECGVAIAQPLAAFCAVGNPDSFFEHVGKEGLPLAYTHAFPDHLQYQQADVSRLSDEAKRAGAASLITTAKDAVKLRELEFGLPCYVLEIEISIDDEGKLRDLIRTKLSSS
jgi:tetraacyldisaccharide 4'-kinase